MDICLLEEGDNNGKGGGGHRLVVQVLRVTRRTGQMQAVLGE